MPLPGIKEAEALALHATGAMQSEGPRVFVLHQTAQRLLERRAIVIPFAELLAEALEPFAHRVECRRVLPMLLALVQASALLHQRQRQEDANGRMIAQPANYAIAARRLLGRTARARWAKGYLSELEDKGCLDPMPAESRGRGGPARARKPSGRDGEEVAGLPTVEELFAPEPLAKFGETQKCPCVSLGSGDPAGAVHEFRRISIRHERAKINPRPGRSCARFWEFRHFAAPIVLLLL